VHVLFTLDAPTQLAYFVFICSFFGYGTFFDNAISEEPFGYITPYASAYSPPNRPELW